MQFWEVTGTPSALHIHSSAQMITLIRQTWFFISMKDNPLSSEWGIYFCVVKPMEMLYHLLFDLLGMAGFHVCLCPLSNGCRLHKLSESRSCLPGTLLPFQEGKGLHFSFAFCQTTPYFFLLFFLLTLMKNHNQAIVFLGDSTPSHGFITLPLSYLSLAQLLCWIPGSYTQLLTWCLHLWAFQM